MKPQQLPKEIQQATRKSLVRYMNGFILSVISTLVIYGLVASHKGSGHAVISTNFLIVIVGVLALFQCFVQLIFFLRLGHEASPRLRLLSFIFMAVVVAILVIGSLWIMNNLNYHMMTPEQIQTFMKGQANGGF